MVADTLTIDAGSSGVAGASSTHGRSLIRIGGTVPPSDLALVVGSPQLAEWLQTSPAPVQLDLVGMAAVVATQVDAIWRALPEVAKGRRIAVSLPSRPFDQLSALLPAYVSSAAAQGFTVRFFAPGSPTLDAWLAQPASSPIARSAKKWLLAAGLLAVAALVAAILRATG